MLKDIYLALVHLAKQVAHLPQAVADVIKQREQRIVDDELEVERLDRIRHPEKYRGK
jgi:hypothetical protein